MKKGEILSLIGQNGAGKSTTFNMLLDFIKPTSGEIIWKNHEKAIIGYMPEERGLYPKLSIKNQIVYFAALHGIKKKFAIKELKLWMKKLNVVGDLDDKIENLSKGNAQKIQLIACLMFKPDLLILDEPFSGLDPVNANLLIDCVLEAKNNGTMIIFSTHNMENVEKLSDYVIMLNHGKTVINNTLSQVYSEYGRNILDIEGYDTSEFYGMRGIKKIIKYNQEKSKIILNDSEFGQFIFNKIIEKKGYVPVFNQHYPQLDYIFKNEVQNNE